MRIGSYEAGWTLPVLLAVLGCKEDATAPEVPEPAAITIVSGDNQIQGRGRDLHEPVVVRAVDAAATPMAGVTLSFLPGPGSGSVSAGSAVTDSIGEASVIWKLGETVGAQQLTVMSAAGSAQATVTATARQSDFDIQIVFAATLTPEQEDAVRAGVERWTQVIVNDLPDISFPQGYAPDNHCSGLRGLTIAPGGVVDDVRLTIDVSESERRRVYGGLCDWRIETREPFLVNIVLTSSLLNTLDAGALSGLVAHQTGHLLGFGWRWSRLLRNRVREFGDGADTHFPDALTVAAFDDAGGSEYDEGGKVPVENYEYPQLADYHWRGDVFQDELMSAWNHRWANPGWKPTSNNPPLSAITVQAMAALGYEIDLSKADAFTVPVPGAAAPASPGDPRSASRHATLKMNPVEIFDDSGNLVSIIYK